MEVASRLHFGALLRQLRLEARMTQQQLAERAKLSVEAIGALERGVRTRPYRETVALLVDALELSENGASLLESAVDVARPRQRHLAGALTPSLLRVVGPDFHGTRRDNLPRRATSFVGRQREISEIIALLQGNRLVTIVGAGGVGKTRAAEHLGSELIATCPDGVWLIDLAPLADPTLVASALASVLQISSTAESILDVVVAHLKGRRALLVLDNCEHMVAATRDVATRIVQACSGVSILSTSREALRASGEQVYRLPSLEVPPDPRADAHSILRYGAVALFIDRALAANSDFALTNSNAPDVADICRRLDGIPLAIELAAARVNILTPRQIAQRLDQRFRLLTAGDARALPRHQTMTALIDWSYDMLTPREQRFFESLSLFAGGCTLDAATAICAMDGEDDLEIVDLVAALASKSLLIVELVDNEPRYQVSESSRQYARKKLIARGEEEALARRHALFYVELAEQREREWHMMPDREWLPQATRELENWRATLEWALTKRCDVALGQRLAAVHAVMLRGFTLTEGRRWVRAANDLVDESTPPRLVAHLEQAAAECARRLGEFKVALEGAERALLRYRELGDTPQTAAMQSLVGVLLSVLGRPVEATPLLREALETADAIGDSRLRAVCLHRLGLVGTGLGDLTGSVSYLTEALGLAKMLGATILAAAIGTALSQNAYLADDPETALRLTVDVLADYRALGSPGTAPNIAYTLADKATYLIALGRYDEAQVQANEALVLACSLQLAFMISRSLQHLGVVALLRPQIEGAIRTVDYVGVARLFGFVEARLIALGDTEDLDHPYYHSALSLLRENMGTDKLTRLMATGAMLTEDEAIAQAQALAAD